MDKINLIRALKKKEHFLWSLLIGLAIFSLLLTSCTKEEQKTLLERLQEIQGIEVTEITALQGFTQSFQIDIIQPVDHNNPGGQTFKQRFYLSNRDESFPMVFYCSGYGNRNNYEVELSYLLQANQIMLVHRYFPDATPSPLDWQYLTIWQAATDQHRIKESLKGIYSGKWVSTGVSKGGMTSLFFRRFYPQDVDVTVAYVAPMMDHPDDPRFEPFLMEQVGSTDCRQKIIQFQRLVLAKKDSLMPFLSEHIQDRGYTFTIFSEAEAFEYSVLEYIFAFWQYGLESDCLSIPDENAGDRELFDHLIDVSPVSYYSDEGFLYFQPLFYQGYTEFGYCPYVTDHLQDLLQSVPQPTYRSFAPLDVNMVFKPGVMQDMNRWLNNQGQQIIYIYGSIDPWTAAAINPVNTLDVLRIVQPGANHRVKIYELDEINRVIQTLERWLNISINTSYIKKQDIPFHRERL